MYKEWIEKRVSGIKEFIDEAEGESKIRGMDILKLKDAIVDKR